MAAAARNGPWTVSCRQEREGRKMDESSTGPGGECAPSPSKEPPGPKRELTVSRRGNIAPFIVMDILRTAIARERAGEPIIHMEVGQPGSPAPSLVREAAKNALERDPIGYTEALGLKPLRERIAHYYEEMHGLAVAPERILVTTGSSAGFVLSFLAAFDAGERVLLPEPGYPCYRQILRALDLTPVFARVGHGNRWMPQPEDLEQAVAEQGATGALIASPANPTGAMASAERLRALVAAAERLGVWFISDEIYHRLTYGEPAETALATSQSAIVINSLSKYYCMTGWRVGWMVVPEELVRQVEVLAQNLYISVPTLSQFAAIAAFDATEELEQIKAGYARNRSALLRELPNVGFRDLVPADGAFYLYADISNFGMPSDVLAQRILDELAVAVTPGLDFDERAGAQYLRFSYAARPQAIEEALGRLATWRGRPV